MKSLNNSVFVPALLTAILVGLVALFTGQITFGNVTATTPNLDKQAEAYVFFATSTNQTVYSTSTTALSTAMNTWTDTNGRIDNGYFVISGAERVTFYFSREGKFGNQGASVFDVDVSPNGTDWYDYADLLNSTSTSPASYSSVSLVGTSTSIVSLDLTNSNFYAVRCNVTETTDGEHFCKASASY